LKYFFSKFSMKDKYNCHLTHIVSYFLDFCRISYENLKLKWHRALKLSASSNVHNWYIVEGYPEKHVQIVYICGGG